MNLILTNNNTHPGKVPCSGIRGRR